MVIEITSTTDDNEAVTAALGDKKEPVESSEVKDEKAEAKSEPDEGTEEKSTENDDAEENKIPKEAAKAATESDESEDDEKPKKPSSHKNRVKRLSEKLTAREQEIEYWKQEALKAKGSKESDKPENIESNDINEGKPNADDFETHEDYIEALTDWKVDDRMAKRDVKTKEAQLKNDYDSKMKTHFERVEKFASKTDDWEDVITDINDIKMPLSIQQLLVESDNGPELMYELAKNRDEFERICSLSPLSAAKAIGKFESKVIRSEETTTTKESIKTTKAPKPLKPVGKSSTGSGGKSIYDEDLTQAEYERLRAKQIAERRNA